MLMACDDFRNSDSAVSVMGHVSQQAGDAASEVERLSLAHFIINSRSLGVYLIAATILVCSIAWGSIATVILLPWFGIILTLCLAHWYLLQRFQLTESGLSADAPPLWLLFASVQIPGILFGLAIAGFGIRLSELNYSLIALIQLALCTAVMIDMAAIRRGFEAFAACILGPSILVYFVDSIEPGGGRLGTLALGLSCLFAVLTLVHNKLYRIMQANLVLTVEQRNLLRLLEDTNRNLHKDRALLATESRTDPLTNIANRRLLEETLSAEWNRCRRSNLPLSCVLVDIDYFKAYNDHFGHDGGDECLRLVARIMDANIRRAGDIVARYGGEEFMVLLPSTDLAGGHRVAIQLQGAMMEAKIPHPASSVAETVSISLGVSSLVPDADVLPAQLFKAADLALYEAKRRGRNRVELANQDTMDSARLAAQGLIG